MYGYILCILKFEHYLVRACIRRAYHKGVRALLREHAVNVYSR